MKQSTQRKPIPKGQHIVPRLHLQHFVGYAPQGQIWTYDAETGTTRSAIPDETAVQNHFYSVENDDGTWNTQIEDYLGTVENAAAPIYEKMLKGYIPNNNQEKADFSTFLAIMYARTPTMRRMYAEMYGRRIQIESYAYGVHDKAFEKLIKDYEKQQGITIDAATQEKLRKDLVDPSKYILQVPKERTFVALTLADKLAPMFFDMNWSLMAPKNGFFITSDNPVVRCVDPKTVHPFYGDHGFLNKTVEITFPLSPKLLLLLTWRRIGAAQVVVEREAVDGWNKVRATHSERHLYAHIEHKNIGKLAQKYKGSRPGMTTSGFGPEKFSEVKVPRRWQKEKTQLHYLPS